MNIFKQSLYEFIEAYGPALAPGELQKLIRDVARRHEDAGNALPESTLVPARRSSYDGKVRRIYAGLVDQVRSREAEILSSRGTSDSVVSVKWTLKKLRRLRAEAERASPVEALAYDPYLKSLENWLSDHRSQLRFVDLWALREQVCRLEKAAAGRSVSPSTSDAETLQSLGYDLEEDFRRTVRLLSGKRMLRRFGKADEFRAMFEDVYNTWLSRFNCGRDVDEKAILDSLNERFPDGFYVRELKQRCTEKEWRSIAATLLRYLWTHGYGKPSPKTDWSSFLRFLESYHALSEIDRRMLFGCGGAGVKWRQDHFEALEAAVRQLRLTMTIGRLIIYGSIGGWLIYTVGKWPVWSWIWNWQWPT